MTWNPKSVSTTDILPTLFSKEKSLNSGANPSIYENSISPSFSLLAISEDNDNRLLNLLGLPRRILYILSAVFLACSSVLVSLGSLLKEPL